MKKIICSLTLFLALATFSFAQTVQEDYDYITKTFKLQLENGLGDKPGYRTKFTQKITIGERTLDLYALARKKDYGETIVAYIAVYTKADNPKVFHCIPHPDSDQIFHDKMWTDICAGNPFANSEDKIKLFFKAMNYCNWNPTHRH